MYPAEKKTAAQTKREASEHSVQQLQNMREQRAPPQEHQAPCKLSAFSPPNNNSVTAAWFFN